MAGPDIPRNRGIGGPGVVLDVRPGTGGDWHPTTNHLPRKSVMNDKKSRPEGRLGRVSAVRDYLRRRRISNAAAAKPPSAKLVGSGMDTA